MAKDSKKRKVLKFAWLVFSIFMVGMMVLLTIGPLFYY